MTKRLTTYLADGIHDILEEWASQERRSVSSLSAFILEQAAREHQKEMKQQPQPSDDKQEKIGVQLGRELFQTNRRQKFFYC
jgi:hypothetical protein